MAREAYEFRVTVPAGTTKAAPLTTPTTIPVRTITRLEYRFPPGCAGLVGFYLAMGGGQAAPLPAGTWIVDDGYSTGYDLTDQPDSGAWQIIAYNLGANPHTLTVRYLADLVKPRGTDLELLPDLMLSNYSTQAGDWHG